MQGLYDCSVVKGEQPEGINIGVAIFGSCEIIVYYNVLGGDCPYGQAGEDIVNIFDMRL